MVLLPALLAWSLAVGNPGALAEPEGSITAGGSAEVAPTAPKGALEAGLVGAARSHYTAAMVAIRDGLFRRALPYLREARALSFAAMQNGPQPHALAMRHLVRIAYVEEELNELAAIEELLSRSLERADDRPALLQARAVLLHNMFLAVRSYTGKTPTRLLNRALQSYEAALADTSRPRTHLQIGYAALLAEKGDRREARAVFNRLADSDLQVDNLDLAVAYYYTAIGDSGRAINRLSDAARRDGWARGGPTRDGVSARHQAYRMHDFDRLRDHPRFHELVSQPEESVLGLRSLSAPPRR